MLTVSVFIFWALVLGEAVLISIAGALLFKRILDTDREAQRKKLLEQLDMTEADVTKKIKGGN